MSEVITIRKDIDFTYARLEKYLNFKYGRKKSGKSFTLQDIQQYALRGHLPKNYGGHKIERIEYYDFGLIILRIEGLKNEMNNIE